MAQTQLKLIISGSTIEAYYYKEKPVRYHFTRPKNDKSSTDLNLSEEEKKQKKIESRKSSMQRSRSTLRRLVNSNAWKWLKPSGQPYLPIFLTLTFKEDVKDTRIANRIFSKFIKRFNYHITEGQKAGFLKYVVVTEFQDLNRDGIIHYHVVLFNMKKVWTDVLTKIWGQGFIKIKKVSHVDNIGAYISKYMAKHFEDNRLDGKKRYFSSRGLKKPIEIFDQEKALKIFKHLTREHLVSEKEFTSSYLGLVGYKQWKLDKKSSILDVVPNFYDLI